MMFWNFETPLTAIASLIWNCSEYFKIPLGKFAPVVFQLMINKSKNRTK